MPQTRTADIVPFTARSAAGQATATVAPPADPAPIAAQRVTELGQRGQWCGVLYVARQLRLEAVDLRTVVAHIRAHIAESGFPAPVTSRLRLGRVVSGAAAVTPKSEWLRAAVDAWVEARHFGAEGDAAAFAGPAAIAGRTPRAVLHHNRAAAVEATLAARFAQGNGKAGA